MANGYFRILHKDQGTFIRLFPPVDGGESIAINEVMSYLELHGIKDYDLVGLNKAIMKFDTEETVFLTKETVLPIRESYQLQISNDKMKAVIRFYAASEGAEEMTAEEVIRDLKNHNVRYGIKSDVLMTYFQDRKFCTDLKIAEGKAPRMGSDAVIQYFFNTDLKAKPKANEDGSVNFFDLSLINHCKKGDLLARLTPADPGENGINVCGESIRPKEVKRNHLQFGKNIDVTQDRTELYAAVSGHVTLAFEKVVVSNVLELPNIDLSTGNIDYDGSVFVHGNIFSNFTVKATGNIEVRGVVEGAVLEAGENITIARGMNGMSKGVLKAGGNVISKYLENAKIYADGYISTESILHCIAQAGADIEVTGRKGFITGGQVSATNTISVKTLGSAMGASTIVEVGINTGLKREQLELQTKLIGNQKMIASIEPVLAVLIQKKQEGRAQKDQLENMQKLAETRKQKMAENNELKLRLAELDEKIAAGLNPCVKVSGEVFPGTKICISDVSMIIKDAVKYCRFVREKGDVRIASL